MSHATLVAWATAASFFAMGCLGYVLGVFHERYECRRRRVPASGKEEADVR